MNMATDFRHRRPSSSTFQLSLIACKPSHWCLIRKSIQSFLAHFWYFAVIRDLTRESYITERETTLWNWKYLCWIVSGMVSFLWKPWLSIVCYNWDVSEDWCISFLMLTSYARDGCASQGTWNLFERMFSAMLELVTLHVFGRFDNHHNTETTWLSETKPFERLFFWGVALKYIYIYI